MKTSFYFVIWIIIYPLLGLFHSPALSQNSFIVALLIVWGLSWLLNRSMPDTLRYEAALTRVSLMELLYSGNIRAIKKRLERQTLIQFITAIYFGVTFIFVLYSILRHSDVNDWIALVLFGLFAFGAINSAVTYNKAVHQIERDPSEETGSGVLGGLYRLDYPSYRSRRLGASAEDMLPSPPPHIKAFRIFSLIIAVICALLGIFQLLRGVGLIVMYHSNVGISGGIMYVLYGSLAAYFGLKDTIDLGNLLRRPKDI